MDDAIFFGNVDQLRHSGGYFYQNSNRRPLLSLQNICYKSLAQSFLNGLVKVNDFFNAYNKIHDESLMTEEERLQYLNLYEQDEQYLWTDNGSVPCFQKYDLEKKLYKKFKLKFDEEMGTVIDPNTSKKCRSEQQVKTYALASMKSLAQKLPAGFLHDTLFAYVLRNAKMKYKQDHIEQYHELALLSMEVFMNARMQRLSTSNFELCWEEFKEVCLKKLISCCNMRFLHISEVFNSVGCLHLINITVSSMQRLTALHLYSTRECQSYHNSIYTIAHYCPHLTELVIAYSWGPYLDAFYRVPTRPQNVNVKDPSNSISLLKQCSKLRSLVLYCFGYGTEVTELCELLLNLPSLEYLYHRDFIDALLNIDDLWSNKNSGNEELAISDFPSSSSNLQITSLNIRQITLTLNLGEYHSQIIRLNSDKDCEVICRLCPKLDKLVVQMPANLSKVIENRNLRLLSARGFWFDRLVLPHLLSRQPITKKYLSVLDLRNITYLQEDLIRVGFEYPNLEVLNIKSCVVDIKDDTLTKLAAHLEKLKLIEDGDEDPQSQKPFPRLSRVILINEKFTPFGNMRCWSTGKAILYLLIFGAPFLETLKVFHSAEGNQEGDEVTHVNLRDIFLRPLPHLKYLYLAGLAGINCKVLGDALRNDKSKLPNLQTLYLHSHRFKYMFNVEQRMKYEEPGFNCDDPLDMFNL